MMNTLNSTEFNKKRTFGVEIEFFGVHYSRVIDALTSKGINIKHESYNHTTCRHWKLVYDVSVSNEGTGNYRGGHELVSPKLKGKKGLDELKLVLETLDEIGAKVNKTCGLHVHHDVNDFELDHFKNAFYLYYKFEKFFDSVVAPSRRGTVNCFCKPFNRQQIEGIKNAQNVYEIKGVLNSDRYHKLNLMSYFRHGTLEFRQHGGSVDSNKILNWVKFTQAIIERAKLETIRVSHDSDTVSVFNQERRLRRTLFGDCKSETLNNEYGEAFRYQMERRRHFESRVA